MKRKINTIIIVIMLIAGIAVLLRGFVFNGTVKKTKKVISADEIWSATKAEVVNQTPIVANVDNTQLKSSIDGIYMNDRMELMIPINKVRDAFNCSARTYSNGEIKIQKGEDILTANIGNNNYKFNDINYELENPVNIVGTQIFVSTKILCDSFNYTYEFDTAANEAEIICRDENANALPYRYSYEEEERVPIAEDQGDLGTCWAFASITALESSLMPEEKHVFSVDNMSLCNSFNRSQDEGGDYNMAMAYLLAWQGPVFEADDPYGDGVSDPNLQEVKHVQEIQLVESKDYTKIKEMIFKYGGVQSTFYAEDLGYYFADSIYYNGITNAYCYKGEAAPNHDIVIIGWDDTYPAENFNMEVEGDGAFLCRNSWGKDFGDNGDFYISYYDTNIGVNNVVYTRVDANNNYDNIYQSDLCGYVGDMGYEESTAYFANVYTAESDESIEAVGFYTTGKNSEYSVYVVKDFQDVKSLGSRSDPVQTGSFENAGFHTVDFNNSIGLSKGTRFAIIVRINTPGAIRPVAVEFAHDYTTESVDITDGEGYISYLGTEWENTESVYSCNVCLKAYTKLDEEEVNNE